MSTPPTISADGSVWNLHRAGVDPIPFAVAGVDLTAVNLVFKVAGGPTVALVPNPSVPTGKLIVFSLSDLAAIPKLGADFYVQPVTGGTAPYLEGKVFVRGFA